MHPTVSFKTIWEQFNMKLSDLVCRKVKHDDICHDILQEIYVKVLLNMEKITIARNMNAYIMQLANNVIMDHYRLAKNRIPWESEDAILLPEDEKSDKSEYQLADCCLRPMIDTLPEKYRDALIQTEIHGITHKQLAQMLNISLPAAKSRVQRGREKLKELILQCCKYEFDKYGNILSCCGN